MKSHYRPSRGFPFALVSALVAGLCLILFCIHLLTVFTPAHAENPIFTDHHAFGYGAGCTYSLAVGHLNNDGLLDLVEGNTRSLCNQEFEIDPQDLVALNQRVGRQAGFFPVETIHKVGDPSGETLDIAVADMNGDGALDIVVAAGYILEGLPPVGGQNYVYFNDGNGNFNTDVDVNCSDPPTNVRCFGSGQDVTTSAAVGDINGDGFLDIVAGNLGGNMLFLNDGMGNFQGFELDTFPVRLGDAVTVTMKLAVGNLDNDGALDIVAGNAGVSFGAGGGPSFAGKENKIYLNPTVQEGGSITYTPRFFGNPQDISHGLALGDLNNDTFLDIVVGNGFTFRDGGNFLNQPNYYYLNDRSANFADEMPLGSDPGYPTLGVAVGDLNSDGRLDIITANFTGPNAVFFNAGNGAFPEEMRQTFGIGADATVSVLVADLNNDSALDIVVGNIGQNLIYLNNQDSEPVEDLIPSFGLPQNDARDVAVADIDTDTDLDIILGNNGQNVIYINENGQILAERLFGPGFDSTTRVIAADMNDDDHIDLMVTNEGQSNIIYLNDGNGNFYTGDINCNSPPPQIRCFGPPESATIDMAVGDFNGDRHLDVVVSNRNEPNMVYLNDGDGSLDTEYLLGSNTDKALAVAAGDIDGDGDLDIAISNEDLNEPNLLYLNNGAGQFQQNPIDCSNPPADVLCFGAKSDLAMSLSMADINGDGALDLITGNLAQQNKVYLNLGLQFDLDVRPFGVGGDLTRSVVSKDVNGDGFTDLIVGNGIIANDDPVTEMSAIYFNDGAGYFPTNNARTLGSTAAATSAIAVGDLDGNGTLDYVIANQRQQNQIIYSLTRIAENLVNDPPYIQIDVPHPSANTDSGASPVIWDSSPISIPFKLYDQEADPVGYIAAYFSQDGGDNWHEAKSANGDVVNLATSPNGVTHTFVWDTFLSGFYGQSDNVVFRIEAYPQKVPTGVPNSYAYFNEVPGPFYWAYASATTLPFRVRGTQVQVFTGTITNGNPLAGALVYRLPNEHQSNALPMADPSSNQIWHTDANGYLQGKGELHVGDRIMALYPITTTQNYIIYYTSAPITVTGPRMLPVTGSGVQKLAVSPDNVLILFNLVVSLEWDARQDMTFLAQLENDLRRTSEILYDITNGQAALGNIHIYHDKGYWGHANIVIRASNRQRPSAVLGGHVLTPTHDIGFTSPGVTATSVITAAYIPGQIAMPPQWNRFGEPNGTIGEDWPRTLAHELGHYLFFVPDNYLGLNADGRLVIVDCPGSTMTDPYQDSYSEFLTQAEWNDDDHSRPDKLDCDDTLAAKYLGRSDWETVTFQEVVTHNNKPLAIQFWPMLNGVTTNKGPNLLPLATTQVRFFEHLSVTAPIAAPFFNLVDAGGDTIAIPPGRGEAYLIRTQRDDDSQENNDPTDDYIISLGTPVGSLVQARGAAPGDRLCVYDYSHDPFRFGCLESIGTVATSVTLQEMPVDWTPQVRVTPISSTTLAVTVTNVLSSSQLNIQLLPALGEASAEISMTQSISGFHQLVTAPKGAYYGHLRIWVPESQPLQEIIVEFTGVEEWGGQAYAWGGQEYAWGSPAPGWSGQAYAWGGQAYAWGGQAYAWGAPVMSGDGQVSIFPLENLFGTQQHFTLQKLPVAPALPTWLLPIGQAYRVTVEGVGIPDSDILFRYLGADVPGGGEAGLRIYYSPDEGATWRGLPTVRDLLRNQASAQIQGEGIYILVATVEVKPAFQEGWNNFGYPVQETRPISQALASIDGSYTAVALYDPALTPPWRTYYVTVTSSFDTLVNTLSELEYPRAYWVYATEPITLYLRPDGDLVAPPLERGLQLPPATFYGWITPTTDFTPTVGMTVMAWIENNLCGQTTIQQLPTGKLYYVLQVMSENFSGSRNGCGQDGSIIRFQVDSWIMNHDHPWQNHVAWFHPLSQPLAAVAGLTATNDSPTASGSPTTLTATITAGDNVIYTWDFGDGTSSGGGMTTTHLYPAPGIYQVTVTASNEVNMMTATTTVIVETVVAGLTAGNDSPTLIGEFTTLTAQVLAGTNVSYHWNFGNGATETGPVVTHRYDRPGNYTAVVTAANSVSTATAVTEVIIIETAPAYKLYLPLVLR